jgi:hypothetical protein
MPLPKTGSVPERSASAGGLTARVVLAALFTALPELLMVNVELWLTLGAALWAIGGLMHLAAAGYYVLGAILAVPGVLVTWWTLRMAVANREDLRVSS